MLLSWLMSGNLLATLVVLAQEYGSPLGQRPVRRRTVGEGPSMAGTSYGQSNPAVALGRRHLRFPIPGH